MCLGTHGAPLLTTPRHSQPLGIVSAAVFITSTPRSCTYSVIWVNMVVQKTMSLNTADILDILGLSDFFTR